MVCLPTCHKRKSPTLPKLRRYTGCEPSQVRRPSTRTTLLSLPSSFTRWPLQLPPPQVGRLLQPFPQLGQVVPTSGWVPGSNLSFLCLSDTAASTQRSSASFLQSLAVFSLAQALCSKRKDCCARRQGAQLEKVLPTSNQCVRYRSR